MNEQLELLQKLFSEPLIDYDGQFHQIRQCGLNPLPSKIPEVWIGGVADAVLKRTARFGSGWMPATLPAGREQEIVDKLHGYLKEFGKDPETFGVDARIVLAQHPEETWRAEYDRWVKFGATHFRCNTMNFGCKTPQEHLQALEKFLRAVKN